MSVQVTAPTRVSSGIIVEPRANNAGEQILASQVLDWTLRGWVFSASQGLEASDIASTASVDDFYPIASLQSPLGGGTVVVPLRCWFSLTNDGAGLGTVDLLFTKAVKQCATTLAITGTTLNIQNHFTPNPQFASKATALKTVTCTALTTVDYITLAHQHYADAALTTSLVVPNFDYQFNNNPIALVEGAALLLYFYNATTTDANAIVTFTWAEIPSSIYVP